MNKDRAIKYLKYFAVFLWLSLLTKTDSFFSVYLIIGILATVIITKTKKQNKKNTWLEYLFASLLSAAVALANYSVFSEAVKSLVLPSLTSVLLVMLSFACGFIVFLNIISFVRNLHFNSSIRHNNPKKIFLISFLVFSLIDLFVLFTCCFPGSLTPDSINEIGQILSGEYSNHHPFYFTMLIYPFINIGINLFNDINIGVAFYSIFQIIVLSAAFSYSISTLSRIGISKKHLVILTVVLALLPYNILYSFTMWKDILFGAAFLVFIVALYRYFTKIQPYKKSELLQIILIIISGLVICLFRSNALVAIFISTIFFFFIFKKEYLKLGFILVLIVISSFILKRPVLKALDIEQPDIIESLSIPSQQIVRSIKANRDNINEEDISLINNVAEIDALIDAYSPTVHDPIKNVIRKNNNQEYLKEHSIDFLSLYVRLGLQYPSEYATAWIDITKGYWNGGYYTSWVWTNEVQTNDYGVERKANTTLNKIFDAYISVFHLAPFLQPLISIGVAVWVLFLVLYRNIFSKKRDLLFLLIPIISTWATLLIATPIHGEFRYVYFLFTCLPFLAIVTITNKPNTPQIKRKESNEKR